MDDMQGHVVRLQPLLPQLASARTRGHQGHTGPLHPEMDTAGTVDTTACTYWVVYTHTGSAAQRKCGTGRELYGILTHSSAPPRESAELVG